MAPPTQNLPNWAYAGQQGDLFAQSAGLPNGVATLDSGGDVPLSQLGNVPPGAVAWGDITGTLADQTDLQAALDEIPVVLSGVSSALAPGAMTAGQTVNRNVTVTGAVAGMVASANPTTYPGDGFVWMALVIGADTVQIILHCLADGTPPSSVYNVRVLQ